MLSSVEKMEEMGCFPPPTALHCTMSVARLNERNVFLGFMSKLKTASSHFMMTSAGCIKPNLCGVEQGMMEHWDIYRAMENPQNLIP